MFKNTKSKSAKLTQSETDNALAQLVAARAQLFEAVRVRVNVGIEVLFDAVNDKDITLAITAYHDLCLNVFSPESSEVFSALIKSTGISEEHLEAVVEAWPQNHESSWKRYCDATAVKNPGLVN